MLNVDNTTNMPNSLPDGLSAVVKRECPTCALIAPVLREVQKRVPLTVYTQDDPSFPKAVSGGVDDTELEAGHDE